MLEALIRQFAGISNETAGENCIPREVIRLMVNLRFIEDDDALAAGTFAVRAIYDPTACTGGVPAEGLDAGLASAMQGCRSSR